MIERIVIKKGLDLPLSGAPPQSINSEVQVSKVAILGDDYLGMRPTMLVGEGDSVKLGQPMFADKKTPGVVYTAPSAGRVTAIHRGEKRRFLGLEIAVDPSVGSVEFPEYGSADIASIERSKVVENLLNSGLWTAIRSRPFGRVANPEGEPFAIFVNAMDTNPLAVNPKIVIAESSELFTIGLVVLKRLTQGTVYVCRAPRSEVPGEGVMGVKIAEFEGPNPAGMTGTHMHFLAPVSRERINWYLNYQDVIAIGKLFSTGQLDTRRVISVAGPAIKQPKIVRVPLGAHIPELLDGELSGESCRVISGSVLCGRAVTAPMDFLGRYHLQVSVLAEGDQRELLGWQMPGFNKFSLTRAFAGAWMKPEKFKLTTSTEGSERAMVPIGSYERVMPLDMLPTLLLRSLISRDTERAQSLGCLELEEEDLALCTVVCPGKYDYGQILRDNLLTIEKEG